MRVASRWNRIVALPVVAGCLACATPQSDVERFEATVHEIATMPESERARAVESLSAAFPETPILERDRALVFWRGEAGRVQWIGDASNWDRQTAPPLSRVRGTDLWWRAEKFPETARLDYKLLVDGDDWILDPRCRRTCIGGYGPNSELRMPGYRPPPELRPDGLPRTVPGGRVEEFTFASAALGEERTFWVYTPHGAEGAEELPSVWFHDGDGYLEFADAARTLDVLIARGDIPRTVGVFVPPVRRREELDVGGEAYLRFVCDELVPHVRDRHRISKEPAKTATIGISRGGLAAVHLALSRPDLFGLSAGHSGAYALGDDAVIGDVREGPPRPVRFHLVVGTYDTALGGDVDSGAMLASQHRLVQALVERGYEHQAYEYPEGHSWGLWKANLGRALRYLYRGETASE